MVVVKRTGVNGMSYLYDTVAGDWKYLKPGEELAETRVSKGWSELLKVADSHSSNAAATCDTATCNCNHCKQERATKAANELHGKIIGRESGDFIPEINPEYLQRMSGKRRPF
jgi:hypothetical protein